MKSKINFILNTDTISDEINPAMVLLDYVRSLKLTGTKEGCKEGDCGACTVIIGGLNEKNELTYKSVNSCLLPMQNVSGKHVVTIEGLNLNDKLLNPVQQAFVDEGASQCGFCTPGFIVSMTSYLLDPNVYNRVEPVDSLDGNICRCTGHNSILRAAKRIMDDMPFDKVLIDLQFLVEKKIIPEYFLSAGKRLLELRGNENKSFETNGKNSYYIGSGTDLFVQRPDELISSNGIYLNLRSDLKEIYEKNGWCNIGSSVTVTQLFESEIIKKIFPEISKFAELFGSAPIRNCATLGGNLNNASPIGDMTALFMALGSIVVLEGTSGTREVPLRNFYKSYKNVDRTPDEFMKSVKFKIPSGDYYINFEKVSKRTYLDIASVNSAMFIRCEDHVISDVGISAGGVAAVPLFLNETSSYLKGKTINPFTIKEAAAIAQSEVSPISDARGSRLYKQLLVERLIYAHFITLFPDLIKIDETL